ncbi:MAG: hypothetical protein QXF01_00785 [Candidatus Micrarchaeaceae archaeon]
MAESGVGTASNEKAASKTLFARLKNPSDIFFIAMLICIIILAVYFRTAMLRFFGFYEPDGFYHYSVIRDAVEHGLVIQPYLSISGYPEPTKVTEPYGLYWVTLIPYAFLRYFGISYYTVERLIPILFGVLDVLGAYLLSRYISKDKLFGLLVMVFVALSGGDEARTSALIYRGDAFAVIFLLLALVGFIEIFRVQSRNKKLLFAVLSGISLSLCDLVFSGGPFAVAVYVITFFLLIVCAFIFAKSDLIENSKYGLVLAFTWWVFTSAYMSIGWMQSQAFTGTQFAYLFIPMILAWCLFYAIINKGEYFVKYVDLHSLLGTPLRRAVFLIALAVVFLIIFEYVGSGFIYDTFINNGFITAGNANIKATAGSIFESTIQELQPPTPAFLFASFATNLYITPPSIIVLISSYIGRDISLIFIALLFSFIPYFFMQVYDSGKFFSGRPRFMFDINVGMIVILSYFAVTAYLQMHAIRFNSLISIPIAILSAYTIYWVASYGISNYSKKFIYGIAGAAVFSAIIMLSVGIQLSILLPSIIKSQTLYGVLSVALGIIAGLLVMLKYLFRFEGRRGLFLSAGLILFSITYASVQYSYFAEYPGIEVASVLMVLSVICIILAEKKWKVNAWYAFGIVFFIYGLAYYNAIFTSELVQADSLNPAFFSALQWFGANSLQNASVLTLWPDGSVVEGVANRTSVMDSVGAQNPNVADPFAAWLLNSSDDPQFLESNIIGRPSYFLIRNTWLTESGGIFTEASVANSNLNGSDYSYIGFSSLTENSNASDLYLQLISQPISFGRYMVAEMLLNRSTLDPIRSTLLVYNTSSNRLIGEAPIGTITLYDQYNSSVTRQNESSPALASSAYSILINYSTVPRQQAALNITGVYALAPGLENSNMFKFLFLCNELSCVWNNKIAKLQLIYHNSDTKIFKIEYNQS